MKRIENKIVKTMRYARFRDGQLTQLYECAICGCMLTRTYFICEDCVEKHLRANNIDMEGFMNYLKQYSIKVNVDRVIVPNAILNPTKWNIIRRNPR
jgi:hypothetical protein